MGRRVQGALGVCDTCHIFLVRATAVSLRCLTAVEFSTLDEAMRDFLVEARVALLQHQAAAAPFLH